MKLNYFYYIAATFFAATAAVTARKFTSFRTIRMSVSPTPDTTKVLINVRPGGFLFSDDFYKEYENTYNQTLSRYFYIPISGPNRYNNTYELERGLGMRYDKRIVDLFEKMGSYKSSYMLSNIIVKELPTEVIPYITIHHNFGMEYILIHTSKMYRDLVKKIIDARYIMHVDVLRLYHINELERNLTADGYTCV